ncbi:hypothetical protein IW140_006457 [Coemansia sp. RSA 1813]|nr:hypothetical protein EV178_006423 [Coemansia sp. RSA 1646]KAJ1765290.1 hypothetical protein LPJ74_006408 [Coemansia sp. RSA 1843]KAJ2085261.1 hypothetical protein IW138_006425 [Coemansia sp. RSA 986]KAJ2210274.1 hypothetical protein EV179_006348 [Coemansia sp. RSA 487]KAJ2562224.1 hypothetical protein IW140_006457 [Coemansia sp. RSA 1813]
MSRVQPLYGGAMSMAIPEGMVDTSVFREVPDHQEVFSDVETDQSIIVEILESVNHQEEKALEYHFNELASSNDAESSTIRTIERLQPEDINGAYVLVGEQQVAKFNEKAKSSDAVNSVCIMMALIRVPQHTADILVSLNVPLRIGQTSSSSFASPAGQAANMDAIHTDFKSMVATFKINDYSLFA